MPLVSRAASCMALLLNRITKDFFAEDFHDFFAGDFPDFFAKKKLY